MHHVRKTLFLLLTLLLLSACGDNKETMARVAAYNAAPAEINKARNSEDLLEISYRLHLELEALGCADEPHSSAEARREYEKAVKNKTVEFYTAVRNKK